MLVLQWSWRLMPLFVVCGIACALAASRLRSGNRVLATRLFALALVFLVCAVLPAVLTLILRDVR